MRCLTVCCNFRIPPASVVSLRECGFRRTFAPGKSAEVTHTNTSINLLKKEMKKETWKLIIQIAINVLTAIATAIGVTSCFAA